MNHDNNPDAEIVDVPHETSSDLYQHIKGSSTVAELLKLIDVDFSHYDEAWWEKRERDLAELKARDLVLAEQQRMLHRAGELDDNGFPLTHVKAAMSTPIDTPAMRHARLFTQVPSRVLVLAGGVGTGKTTAATWVALKTGDYHPGFIRASELERRGRYDKPLDHWLDTKSSLVIDDLGAEVLDGKGVFRSLLDEIVDTFYSNRRRLIITTNLRPRRTSTDDQEQFLERYGDRVASRVKQIGLWGDCGMEDLRKVQSA